MSSDRGDTGILDSIVSGAYGQATTRESDTIAQAVLEKFSFLPETRKPPVRNNDVHEWVPLSGIVARGISLSSPTAMPNDTG